MGRIILVDLVGAPVPRDLVVLADLVDLEGTAASAIRVAVALHIVVVAGDSRISTALASPGYR